MNPGSERFLAREGDTAFLSLCVSCRHKRPDAPTCAAFPAGIPTPFLSGRLKHTEPYSGDHGIRYEPRDTRR